jgi:hypothetical protein
MILVDNFNVPTLFVHQTTQLADLEVMMFINADYSLVFLGVIPKFTASRMDEKSLLCLGTFMRNMTL